MTWRTFPGFVPMFPGLERPSGWGPSSDGLGLGGAVEAGRFTLKTSWERYIQAGAPKLDYFSLGTSVNF